MAIDPVLEASELPLADQHIQPAPTSNAWQAAYPLIDADPHFRRVVRHMNGQDILLGLGLGASAPTLAWLSSSSLFASSQPPPSATAQSVGRTPSAVAANPATRPLTPAGRRQFILLSACLGLSAAFLTTYQRTCRPSLDSYKS